MLLCTRLVNNNRLLVRLHRIWWWWSEHRQQLFCFAEIFIQISSSSIEYSSSLSSCTTFDQKTYCRIVSLRWMTSQYTSVSSYQLDPISTGPVMSNYSNPSDSFRPVSFVALAHSISKSDFSANKAYAVAVATLPGILTGLGVLSLLCFLMGLLFRCCPVTCFCCKCYPHTNPRDSDEKVCLPSLSYNKTSVDVY